MIMGDWKCWEGKETQPQLFPLWFLLVSNNWPLVGSLAKTDDDHGDRMELWVFDKRMFDFSKYAQFDILSKNGNKLLQNKGKGAQIKDLFTLWQIWNKVSSYIKVNSGTWPSLSARTDPRREVQWSKSLKYSGKLQV